METSDPELSVRGRGRGILRTVFASGLLVSAMLVLGGVLQWFGNDLKWGGYVACSVFYGLMFFLGLVESTPKKADSDQMLLAGRSLPLGTALLTMTATWVGGGFINGSAEAAYASGLAWTQAPIGYALSLILGGCFFARPMRRHRYTTMLDPLGDRFGSTMAAVLYLPALLGEIFWTAAILTALGTTFGLILDVDFSLSIVMSACIAILYTSVGGLRSVARTDVLQLAILILGLYAAVPFLLPDASMAELWSSYRAKHGTYAFPWPSIGWGSEILLWLDYALLLMLGGIPWHVYFQRVLASKSESVAQGLSIAAGGLCLLAAIPAVLAGMVCAVTDWESLGLSGPANAALALPYTLQHLAPAWMGAVAVGAIAAAVMSSVDSSILSASSMGAWNVYRPLANRRGSAKNVHVVVRRLIWIIGITATLLALQIKSVYALWFLCSDLVYCILFPQLVCALFDRKANAIGSGAGVFVSVILRLGGGEPALGIPAWISYPLVSVDGAVHFPFRTTSMLAGLITVMIVSRLTQKQSPPRQLVPRPK